MKSKYLTVILIAIVLPLIFFLNTTRIISSVRNTAISWSKPLLEAAHFMSFNITEGVHRFQEYARAARVNMQLRDEIILLREENVRLKEVRSENERLRALLEFKGTQSSPTKGARIIGRDSSTWTHGIILDRGTDSGMTKDMPIIAPGGLVGRIETVGPDVSRGLLILDVESKVSAQVQESRALGVIQGEGNGYLRLRFIPLDTPLAVGDTVLTSGMGDIFPRGIPIGTIVMVGKESNGLHLYAQVQPFVAFSRLEEVLCLEK